MFADDIYLSWTVTILFHLTLTQALRVLSSPTTNTSLTNTANATMTTSVDRRTDQSPNMIHDAFARIDRGTFIRGTIVLGGITGLILLYVGLKAFLLRKKRQPKRYTLITDPTTIEEPIFDAPDDDDDEEDETEDNTLFVRK